MSLLKTTSKTTVMQSSDIYNVSICKDTGLRISLSSPLNPLSKTDRHSSHQKSESVLSSEGTAQLKQPPQPNDAKQLNRLTKSLLEQHEAFQEIDYNDE